MSVFKGIGVLNRLCAISSMSFTLLSVLLNGVSINVLVAPRPPPSSAPNPNLRTFYTKGIMSELTATVDW